MIRVMIVEDEPPTLWRLAGMVEQLDPLFSVVATALNGQSALSQMETIPCDVVLTDIRMPVMNGLDLMDRIRETYPECIVVVLSGYQDFAYVSHAIRARSLDYLLKPVSAETMAELLGRIRAQYMKMSRERLKRELSLHLNKAEVGIPQEETERDQVGVCLFCAGGFPFGDDAEMYPAADFWHGRSLEKLGEELSPGFAGFTWEFMGHTPVERIFIYQTEGGSADAWVQCLHEALLEDSGISVSCALLQEAVSLSKTNEAIRTLRRALREHMQIGRSLFLPVTNEDPAMPPQEDPEEVRRLAQLLASGDVDQEHPRRRALFTRMEREQWTQQRILDLFLGALRQMERSEQESLRALARQYQDILPDIICAATSLKELEQNLGSLLQLAEEKSMEDPLRQEPVLAAVEEYLRTHYPEHITNQQLAAKFGYVPSYLSLLFRQKYQLSPSEYLTRIRIDEAKAYMAQHPDMLMREVADKVGFKNQHHFSRIFKQLEGVRPTGYRGV